MSNVPLDRRAIGNACSDGVGEQRLLEGNLDLAPVLHCRARDLVPHVPCFGLQAGDVKDTLLSHPAFLQRIAVANQLIHHSCQFERLSQRFDPTRPRPRRRQCAETFHHRFRHPSTWSTVGSTPILLSADRFCSALTARGVSRKNDFVRPANAVSQSARLGILRLSRFTLTGELFF